MGRAGVAGVGLVVLGVAGIVVAVVADLGRWPYYGGAAAVVVGLGLLLAGALRRRTLLVPAVTAVAVLVGGGAWLGLNGFPEDHAAWPERAEGYDITGDAGRLGDAWFTGAAAYDIATGEARWTTWGDGAAPSTAEDIDLVALTDTAVISFEPTGGRRGGRLVSRDPADGSERWSATSESGRGVAVDGDALVVSSSEGTWAHDLRTGEPTWTSTTPSAPMCDLGGLHHTHGPARQQSVVVAMDEDAAGASADLLRVVDGETISSDVACLNGARVLGDVLVHADGDRLEGRSVEDGTVLWRAPEHLEPRAWALSGSGPTAFVPDDLEYSDGDMVVPRYFAVDVATGAVSETSPPDGWRVLRDETRDELGDPVRQPVVREDGGLGVWELGTDRVIEVPAAASYPEFVQDAPSGWFVLAADVEDAVGDRHRRTWAISPEGGLRGPFDGRGAYIADGLLQVDDVVHPVD